LCFYGTRWCGSVDTDEALLKCRDLGCELYRTDLHGNVTTVSDGTEIIVSAQRQTSGDVFAPAR
jgi:hypothetical protein